MVRGLGRLVLALAVAQTAHAYRVTPLEAALGVEGTAATRTFLLENNSKAKIAVQVEAFARSIDGKAQEVRTPTEELVVFPDQIVLEAGQQRNVRVTYNGPTKVAAEKAYRVSFEQLPLSLEKGKNSKKTEAKLSFMFNYLASVYVGPDNAKPAARVESLKVLPSGKAELKLVNPGTAHAPLNLSNLRVTTADNPPQKVELTEKMLEPLRLVNLLAGAEVTIELDWPASARAAKGPLKAELETPTP